MTPYEMALAYLGEREGAAALDNPVILEMYASVGHPEVRSDDVAWCAAFVGHCIELVGLQSTRSLAARSYLDWGVEVEPDDAREGDIVVFWRGSRSSWQGHVAFFIRRLGNQIEVLGGNQGDAVSIARYPAARLLAIRRPPHAPSSVPILGDPSEPYRLEGERK